MLFSILWSCGAFEKTICKIVKLFVNHPHSNAALKSNVYKLVFWLIDVDSVSMIKL